MNRKILIGLFLVSGMAGLVYEVVWVRMLTLVFGATTYAVSTVLFSFMAGLALGSYFFGKKIDSVRSPLRVYGFLEIGIGVYALLVPGIIELLNGAYISMFSEDIPNFFTYSLFRFIFATAVMLIPTTLMGGTLPVLSRHYVRGMGTLGWDVGVLYTINTLGAVFGVLLAGFFLEATFGVNMSIQIAAAVNILIGIVCLYLSTLPGFSLVSESSDRPAPRRADAAEVEVEKKVIDPRFILWAFAISGFCALGYEVIWFRALILALYNNTYAFSIMLVTFLSGLALGSYLVSRVIDGKRDWVATFAKIEMAIGVAAMLALPVFIVLQNSVLIWLRNYLGGSFHGVTLAGFILAAVMMFIPTLLFGLTLPVANKIYINNLRDVGKKVGRLYAVNTLGAVLGSFIVGFLLIPYIGFIRANVILGILNLLAGISILYGLRGYPPQKKKTMYGVVAGVVAVALVSLTATDRISSLHVDMVKGAKTIFYREGAASTVSIVEMQGSRAAFVNGTLVVGGTRGALQTVRMLAHLPMLLHDGSNEDVVVVGFGMGVTTYSVSLYEPARFDVVEIAPEVLAGAPYFRNLNHGIYDDPDLHIVIEDGRNYLLRTRKRPDVITADPTHPILGSGSLYTSEYYQQAYDKLGADGVMAQYLPLHLLGNDEFRSIMATFASVFEHSSLWYSLTDLVIVGTKQPLFADYSALRGDMAEPAINKDLKLSSLDSPLRLFSHFLMGEKKVREYVAGAAINTDDHPIVEFHGPKSIGVKTQASNLESLRPYIENVKSYVDLSGLSPTESLEVMAELDALERSNRYVVDGMINEYRKDMQTARGAYRAAVRAYQDNPDIIDKLKVLDARLKSD